MPKKRFKVRSDIEKKFLKIGTKILLQSQIRAKNVWDKIHPNFALS